MKRFFSILVTIALCASASAQTVKPLAYNMTNGTVMVSTNVTWSNSFKFSTNTVAAQVRTNLGLGWPALTNTDAANFCAALLFDHYPDDGGPLPQSSKSLWDGANGEVALQIEDQSITFGANSPASLWRSSLGLGLPALTNTSNVTMMRALSGSTNTNQPYSGSISVVGTNNTNTLTFSNGILQFVQ